ncbi:adenine deaminase C-terminal domain-containing protein [Lottiidibacillus patelloidae]|nr:adenine deaminase C-terminal domain-containing protein [Lottiidibacillus patelloidae]
MFHWDVEQIRKQINVIKGKENPSKVLKNVTYLNGPLKKWLSGHIWISENRIIYVGEELPENLENTEVVDCTGQFAVPGYIEPHAHPFQLYNPLTLAHYASLRGTTTLVSDNLLLSILFNKQQAFSFINALDKEVSSFYWWARYDSQTVLQNERQTYTKETLKAWTDHPNVLQGGELTGWPKVLAGEDELVKAMIETRKNNKPIEGHLPAASAKTLTQLALLGVTSDHESMTGKDVFERLRLGYNVALRYSSIRPDLPALLEEMKEYDLASYDKIMFTTDGSTPAFYEQGVIDKMISIALENGIPSEEAYNMASYNAARHLRIDDVHGIIAPGQIAHINILSDINNPTPIAVLASGEWVLRNKEACMEEKPFPWADFDVEKLNISWELKEADFQFETKTGLKMLNSVIIKPYEREEEALAEDESYVMLIDRNGKWRVNTILKGFATNVCGFVSSYSNSGDIILIGRNKNRMIAAFNRMKQIGGGIVLSDNEELVYELPLPLAGAFSDMPLVWLAKENTKLKEMLQERGYRFEDPVYTLLFLSSIHLPYIRVTPAGIYNVMQKSILNPFEVR